MAIHGVGTPIWMSEIATEFGGTAPHWLNEYYAGGVNVPAGTTGVAGAISSAGNITMYQFYGSTNLVPGSITIVTTAATTFVVPVGATSLRVDAAAGGGSGGTGWCCDNSCSGGGGGGGGGGAAISGTIAVTPGQVLTINVGKGGSYHPAASVSGRPGDDTTIVGTGINILLAGGKGGAPGGNGGGGGIGGLGGIVTSITGFTGTAVPGGAGGQANPSGGCVSGIAGSSTVFATGGAGGGAGYYSGGGGGGGASYGAGGAGRRGSPYFDLATAAGYGGGGGGAGDETISVSYPGGNGFITFSWG